MAGKGVYYLQICQYEITSHLTVVEIQSIQTYESDKEKDGRRNVVTNKREVRGRVAGWKVTGERTRRKKE